MNLANIWNVATYESKTLFRSWFFRIFSIIALLFLFGINAGMFGAHSGSRWTTRAIAANLPYSNVLFISVAQAVIAVFLASDFLKRDKKLDTTEVIYARPITNGEYVTGKTLGILVLFLGLVLLALIMALVFNLIRQDIPVVWEAYLYYPLLITVPTLIFILGLSFFMMILFRSQAVTFLVLLGYIGLTLFYFQDKLYGMLDYMAFNLPMVRSDFIRFAELDRILLHRLSYLLLGTGFIFATIRFLNRLPQTGRWNSLNLIAFFLFIAGGLFFGYRYYSIFHLQTVHRETYLALNNRFASVAVPDVISNDLDVVQQARHLQISSSIRMTNNQPVSIDTLLFSLNPGFTIDSITDRDGPVPFLRTEQILRIVPPGPLSPGRNYMVRIHYRGSPDESVAYLDIPRKNYESLKRIQVATVDKKPGIVNEDYLLLTPELNWYPMAGVAFNLVNFQPRKIDFATYTLRIRPGENLTAVAPGEMEEEADGTVVYRPEQDLNVFPLVIGPFEKRSREIEGVTYNLFIKPGHDYFSPYFTMIGDTLDALIKQAKDDYEIDDLDLYYAFNRINLVEVPVQFHAYERPYTQTVETILPEMILLPEKGAGLNTLDFERYKRAEERRDRDRENQRSPREIEIAQFRRFLQNTFFRSETSSGSMGPFGGGEGGEELITFQGETGYSRNPYCVFPLYYSYVTGISSDSYPIFNSMMEVYLKEGFEVSPRQGFTGGITDNEKANLALRNHTLTDVFAQWNTDLTAALINQTGSYLISALKNRVGMGDFDYFLYYYLEDHAFSEIPFSRFEADFRREFNVDMEPYMEIFDSDRGLATFLVSEPDFIQTRDNIGEVYIVRFRVTNTGEATGMLEITYRIMGQGGFGGGGEPTTERRLYEVRAGETREMQTVLFDRPMLMTVNTLISGNIPSSYNVFLRSATEQQRADLEEYSRPVDQPVSITYQGEYVVDNEDKGFSTVSVSRESKLKQYIDSRKVSDEEISYGSLNPYWSPAKWTPVAHSAYYGESIRSAMVIRKGDGSSSATWKIRLPDPGFYDLYFYVPVSAMYSRPSGRGRGGGGEQVEGGPGSGGQGEGGRRFGPRFADEGTDYHFTISSNEGSEELVYVLNNPEEGWNRLGTFHFPADTAMVELTNRTGGRRVIADAVKWVWRPD